MPHTTGQPPTIDHRHRHKWQAAGNPPHPTMWDEDRERKNRLTDEQVALEYENLMERFPTAEREHVANSNACFVRAARQKYPGINSGLDLMAWVDEEED